MNRAAPLIAGVILLLAAAAVPGAEVGAPPLDPTPKATPLIPGSEDPAALSPEARLQLRLAELVRERERRIQEILGTSGTPRRLPLVKGNASLEQSRQERDQAWDDLRALLAAEGQPAPVSDPLNAGRPLAQAGQVPILAAVNQLRIAECYQELAASPRPEPGDLGEGNATLAKLDPIQLPETERPRYHYLLTWFLAERARAATGVERDRLVAEAAKQQQLLAQRYPDNELTKAAKILLLDFNTATAPATAPGEKPK
jgi:hypothetical protein